MGREITEARRVLHLVATHVMARRRYESSGRIGLRAAPGGIATPAFGPAPERLRTAGAALVREVGGDASYTSIDGSSLRELAAFAETKLDAPFDAGRDSPDPGDPNATLQLDPDAAQRLADWWALAYRVLDTVVSGLPIGAAPGTIQIWPEHFDAATNVAVDGVGRVNLGFSAGDSWRDEPYAYIGPWEPVRPGDNGYWNAPFGATLGASEFGGAPPEQVSLEFFETGLRYLRGEQP